MVLGLEEEEEEKKREKEKGKRGEENEGNEWVLDYCGKEERKEGGNLVRI